MESPERSRSEGLLLPRSALRLESPRRRHAGGAQNPAIVFPRDEGRHPGTTDEWWYFNCHVKASGGREYGLAVCFFPGYVLDILVDLSERKVLHRSGGSCPGFVASTKDLDISLGSSWWRRDGSDPSSYSMYYEGEGLSAYLRMRPSKPPLFVGGSGKIREGLLGSSYYYAQTNIEVSGEVRLDGKSTKVQGKGWIDRQWGTWEWSGLGGWRWFSIQLENGEELLGIQITHPLTGKVTTQSFNLSRKGGETEIMTGVAVEELRRWRSPETSVEYGVGWRVKCGDQLDLLIEASVEPQEITSGLWEGSCLVSGTRLGTPVTGRAFVELSRTRVHSRGSVMAVLLALGLLDRLARNAGLRLDLVGRALSLIARRG